VYGVSFPSKKEMDEHVALIEEAEKRDHRRIGREQKLFDMHEWCPGAGFFYPEGMKIYTKLTEMIKD
jgi:threonyl-tRNA synthetase